MGYGCKSARRSTTCEGACGDLWCCINLAPSHRAAEAYSGARAAGCASGGKVYLRCCVRVGNGRTYFIQSRSSSRPAVRRFCGEVGAPTAHRMTMRHVGARRGGQSGATTRLISALFFGSLGVGQLAVQPPLSVPYPLSTPRRAGCSPTPPATAAACGASISSPPTCRARSSTARSSTPGSPPATSSSDTPRTYS